MQQTFGPLIIDLAGIELQAEEKELIEHPLVGGVIFFTRNYESPEQLQALTTQIRQLNKPLLLMVDQEGGRVQRFRQGFTRIPPAASYSEAAGDNPALGLALAELGGWVMAYELLAKGIDLSLAPVLDLDKGLSAVIGDRAFHRQPQQAISLAAAYIQGMKAAGMAACGKHFPGHGAVAPDSHKELPVDPRSWEAIEKDDLQPFLHFTQAKIPALMTAHLLFPALDQWPVSFSRYWLQDILRQKLRFEGVVISDDLDMKGAELLGDYAERMKAACEAGCDIILLCNNRPAVIQVLDRISASSYLLDFKKFDLLRGNFAATSQSPEQNKLWQSRRDLLLKHCETA